MVWRKETRLTIRRIPLLLPLLAFVLSGCETIDKGLLVDAGGLLPVIFPASRSRLAIVTWLEVPGF